MAETMNNYLMFDKLLKVRVVEPEKVTPRMFRCRGPKREIPLPARLKTAQRYFNQVCLEMLYTLAITYNHMTLSLPLPPPKGYSEGRRRKRVERLLEREKTKREKLAALGISYDFPGYQHCSDDSAGPSHILFSDPQSDTGE